MMTSADGDDQADQQHELADPSMAEPGHAVLQTPWPQPCSRHVVMLSAITSDAISVVPFASDEDNVVLDELTVKARFTLPELTARVNGTRPVNSASGNRALGDWQFAVTEGEISTVL